MHEKEQMCISVKISALTESKWVLKSDKRGWTGFIWLRIGTRDRLL
jgi:hypothetical protein